MNRAFSQGGIPSFDAKHGIAVFAGLNYPFLTSKERDNETGLDYFLARYYSSAMGRFTSPDEFTGGPCVFRRL
ncbi:MAG TPA: RHS repeat-associated core domain-containing protein [Pyrinomonadaceae bacterium]|jgi:RHS repeat-associated protein|nr:RHS repeat-associated core domain-containing protein [Pyrinomonadaceae bacterium]